MKRGLVTNSIVVLGGLSIVFLSQLVFFRPLTKSLAIQEASIKDKIPYANEAQDWFHDSIYNPLTRASGEAARQANVLQEEIQQEIVEQKNNLEKSSLDSLKKTLAEKILYSLGLKAEDLVDQTTFCHK